MRMSGEPEGAQPAAVDVAALDTYAVIGLFINILAVQAWQHLGLRVKPGTDKAARDDERARVAIDCLRFLVDQVAPTLPANETRRLRNLVTDLQLNFVRLTGEQPAGDATA
jgi:hypothetical protein